MRSIRTKPIDAITFADLEELVSSETPESQDFEFKETLPARGDQVDPWITGGSSIGNRARDTLIAEIVGFANSYGGHLLLGVTESSDNPRRAAGLNPLPRANDLVERLSLQIRDCVEPELPGVQLKAIHTGTTDHGVILIRIPQSTLRPHRQVQTLASFARRADRTESMTMREIQDLTLLRTRENARIDEAFAASRERFSKTFASYRTDAPNGICALRITAHPTGTVPLDQTAVRQASIQPVSADYTAHDQAGAVQLMFPIYGWNQRPILRGMRWTSEQSELALIRELHYDGDFESILWEAPSNAGEIVIFSQWIAAELVNTLRTLDQVRRVGGNPGLEFGIEVELRRRGSPIQIMPFRPTVFARSVLGTESPQLLLPRFGYQNRDEIEGIIGFVVRDLHEAAGHGFQLKSWRLDLPSD